MNPCHWCRWTVTAPISGIQEWWHKISLHTSLMSSFGPFLHQFTSLHRYKFTSTSTNIFTSTIVHIINAITDSTVHYSQFITKSQHQFYDQLTTKSEVHTSHTQVHNQVIKLTPAMEAGLSKWNSPLLITWDSKKPASSSWMLDNKLSSKGLVGTSKSCVFGKRNTCS